MPIRSIPPSARSLHAASRHAENSPVARDSPDSGSLGSVYVPEEVQIEYTEHAPRGQARFRRSGGVDVAEMRTRPPLLATPPQIRPGVSDEQSLASLSSLLDAQVGTLRHELMACMLEQRAGIMRAGEAAAEGERRHGMKRLALKQREVDDLQAQLSSARKRGEEPRHGWRHSIRMRCTRCHTRLVAAPSVYP